MIVFTFIVFCIEITENNADPDQTPHSVMSEMGLYCLHMSLKWISAWPRSAIGRAPDSEVRGPGFDTRSGNILSFLLPLFQDGQLSVTGESMCMKYWLTAKEV